MNFGLLIGQIALQVTLWRRQNNGSGALPQTLRELRKRKDLHITLCKKILEKFCLF